MIRYSTIIMLFLAICLSAFCCSLKSSENTNGSIEKLAEKYASLRADDLTQNNEFQEKFWSVLLRQNTAAKELSSKSIKNIEYLSCLTTQIDCNYFAQAASIDDMFTILGIYFNTIDLNNPPYTFSLGKDVYGDDFCTMSYEQANEIICATIGTELPKNMDYHEFGYVTCKNSEYKCQTGDFEGEENYVHAYKYLGDSLFYVIVGSDDTALAGSEGLKKGKVNDTLHLIIKESDSKWGFTVISKLKHHEQSLLKQDWVLSTDFVTIR